MIVSLQEFVMGIKEMPRLARFIPKIMLAITVTACDEVYRKIACWLNDMGESHILSRASLLENRLTKIALCESLVILFSLISDQFKHLQCIVLIYRLLSRYNKRCFYIVFPQKTIDSRVPMRKISSSKWFL